MDRRSFIAALAGAPAARALAQESAPLPRQKISAATLYEALSARFPVRLGVAGLLQLRLSAPRLLMLPTRNKLGASLRAEVSGLQLPQDQAGEMDLVFALRYEATDRTLRAYQPEVLAVRGPGLPPETAEALQELVPALAGSMGELVLHRFAPRDLALADTMGFEPRELQVVDDGLVIVFGPKAHA